MRNALTAVLFFVAPLITWPSVQCTAAPLYQILNLGIPDSVATGLNDSGQVIGQVRATSLDSQAFRTQRNAPINLLGDLLESGNISWANAINSSGQVVGYASSGLSRWDPGQNGIVNLGPPQSQLEGPPGDVWAINDQGQVAGGLTNAMAFRSAPNATINTATDHIGYGTALGLNSWGQAVGATESVAFRTGPNSSINTATDLLGTLGGRSSVAQAINDMGQVVGWAETPTTSRHAFLVEPGSVLTPSADLGTLGGSNSWATGLNRSGAVVGVSMVASQVPLPNQHGFLFVDGVMFDLNDLVVNSTGMVIISAAGINSRGQIAATGQFGREIEGEFIPGGDLYALLLTPVPEPSSIVLMIAATLGLAAAASFRRAKN